MPNDLYKTMILAVLATAVAGLIVTSGGGGARGVTGSGVRSGVGSTLSSLPPRSVQVPGPPGISTGKAQAFVHTKVSASAITPTPTITVMDVFDDDKTYEQVMLTQFAKYAASSELASPLLVLPQVPDPAVVLEHTLMIPLDDIPMTMCQDSVLRTVCVLKSDPSGASEPTSMGTCTAFNVDKHICMCGLRLPSLRDAHGMFAAIWCRLYQRGTRPINTQL